MSTMRNVYLACALVGVSGCSGADVGAPGGQSASGSQTATEQAGTVQQNLTVAVGPRSVSFEYIDMDFLPGGVAGGQSVVFIGEPLSGAVHAFARFTGRPIGDLPPPPGGFVLPFIMHKELAPGRLRVLLYDGA